MSPTAQTSDTSTPLTRTEKQKSKNQSLGGCRVHQPATAILTNVLRPPGVEDVVQRATTMIDARHRTGDPSKPRRSGTLCTCVPSRNGSRKEEAGWSTPALRTLTTSSESRKNHPAQPPLLPRTPPLPAGRNCSLFSFFSFFANLSNCQSQ